MERDRGPKRGGKDGGLRVNREIRAPEVRVIDEDGTMLGVFPPSEALRMAEAKGLDLIEIAPTAKPPTCKITDYGKYKYEAKKKEHQARKNQTVITIKEIQLRPRTDQHDLDVKMKHARRFILEGDKVKVNLRFYGREMAHQEVGFELLKRVIRALNDVAMVETNPKMEGRQLFVLLTPDLTKLKDIEKAAQKEADAAEAAARKANGGVDVKKAEGEAAPAKEPRVQREPKAPRLRPVAEPVAEVEASAPVSSPVSTSPISSPVSSGPTRSGPSPITSSSSGPSGGPSSGPSSGPKPRISGPVPKKPVTDDQA